MRIAAGSDVGHCPRNDRCGFLSALSFRAAQRRGNPFSPQEYRGLPRRACALLAMTPHPSRLRSAPSPRGEGFGVHPHIRDTNGRASIGCSPPHPRKKDKCMTCFRGCGDPEHGRERPGISEAALCQAKRKAQGILCVFPSIFVMHGAKTAGKIGRFPFVLRIRIRAAWRRSSSRRGPWCWRPRRSGYTGPWRRRAWP